MYQFEMRSMQMMERLVAVVSEGVCVLLSEADLQKRVQTVRYQGIGWSSL